jgi:periplasmic divalent cation tolerance protein
MAPEVLLVISTFPDAETAERIGRALVTENLAACANILPPVRSIYRWQEKIEDAAEIVALLKTTAGKYAALERRVKELHPYDVPEIIALPVSRGLDAYMKWLGESCA